MRGTCLNLSGPRQPKPGVWYRRKLSASPTLRGNTRAGIDQDQMGDKVCPRSDIHAPSHDPSDPPLALQQVRRKPFRVLDALEEPAIDGRGPERGSRAEKKCERDNGVCVEL